MPRESMSDGYLLHARFWSKVEVRRPDDCWQWLGTRNQRGYGQFEYGGTTVGAHRVCLLLSTGSMPVNYACHRCNNPSCVNPRHVYDGSPRDNKADSVRAGTANRDTSATFGKHRMGERHQNAKLTDTQVIEIRERAKTVSIGQLSREFNTPHGTIYCIVRGKSRTITTPTRPT